MKFLNNILRVFGICLVPTKVFDPFTESIGIVFANKKVEPIDLNNFFFNSSTIEKKYKKEIDRAMCKELKKKITFRHESFPFSLTTRYVGSIKIITKNENAK